MSQQAFVARFGSLYEHSPWVAQRTWESASGAVPDNLDGLADALAATLDAAARSEQMALILAHPDLAGKAAIAGQLTTESTDEQTSAGISQCSELEFEQFQQLNESYKQKFGFPFIMAVRGSNKRMILQAFKQRVQHDAETEFALALQEINKIARLRLQAMVESEAN